MILQLGSIAKWHFPLTVKSRHLHMTEGQSQHARKITLNLNWGKCSCINQIQAIISSNKKFVLLSRKFEPIKYKPIQSSDFNC